MKAKNRTGLENFSLKSSTDLGGTVWYAIAFPPLVTAVPNLAVWMFSRPHTCILSANSGIRNSKSIDLHYQNIILKEAGVDVSNSGLSEWAI